jgi:hypothetical protein
MNEKRSYDGVKPFSMGSGLAMRYRARFADELEDIMFKSEDDGMVVAEVESLSFGSAP